MSSILARSLQYQYSKPLAAADVAAAGVRRSKWNITVESEEISWFSPRAAIVASTRPIFNAIAPRASGRGAVSPPLLSLLSRSTFFDLSPCLNLGGANSDEQLGRIVGNMTCLRRCTIMCNPLVTDEFIRRTLLSPACASLEYVEIFYGTCPNITEVGQVAVLRHTSERLVAIHCELLAEYCDGKSDLLQKLAAAGIIDELLAILNRSHVENLSLWSCAALLLHVVLQEAPPTTPRVARSIARTIIPLFDADDIPTRNNITCVMCSLVEEGLPMEVIDAVIDTGAPLVALEAMKAIVSDRSRLLTIEVTGLHNISNKVFGMLALHLVNHGRSHEFHRRFVQRHPETGAGGLLDAVRAFFNIVHNEEDREISNAVDNVPALRDTTGGMWQLLEDFCRIPALQSDVQSLILLAARIAANEARDVQCEDGGNSFDQIVKPPAPPPTEEQIEERRRALQAELQAEGAPQSFIDTVEVSPFDFPGYSSGVEVTFVGTSSYAVPVSLACFTPIDFDDEIKALAAVTRRFKAGSTCGVPLLRSDDEDDEDDDAAQHQQQRKQKYKRGQQQQQQNNDDDEDDEEGAEAEADENAREERDDDLEPLPDGFSSWAAVRLKRMQVLAAVLDLPDMLKLICCSIGFAADLPDFSGESDSDDDDEDDQDEQKVERFNAVTNAERTVGLLYCAAVGVSNSLEHLKQKKQQQQKAGRHKRGQPKRRQRVDDDGSKQQGKLEGEAHIEDEAILDEIDLVCQGIHASLKQLLEIGKPHHPQREQDDDEQQQREEQDGFLKRMLDRIANGHAFGRLQMNSCFLQGAIAAMEGFE